MPSAANAIYWPEIYTNQSIVIENSKDPYSDTPTPKCFGTVSPLDPGMFAGIDEYVQDLLGPKSLAKYSPIEVATWLEDLADESAAKLVKYTPETADERRLAIDAAIQNGIGRFFAAKFRAAIYFRIYTRTGQASAKDQALQNYRTARAAWQTIVDTAQGVYRDDLTFGYAPYLRGNWKDRSEAIDRDIAAMEASHYSASPASEVQVPNQYRRPEASIRHNPVAHFKPGEAVTIRAESASPITLHYRRVNQSETWQSGEMKSGRAEIPAAYTQTEFPLQYYFESNGLLHPGLPRDFSHAPYFVIRA
jgi:hypothetical protein